MAGRRPHFWYVETCGDAGQVDDPVEVGGPGEARRLAELRDDRARERAAGRYDVPARLAGDGDRSYSRAWWCVEADTQAEAITAAARLASGEHPDQHAIEHAHQLVNLGLTN